jgi:hypothetical protein
MAEDTPRAFFATQASDPGAVLAVGTYADSDGTAVGMLSYLHVPGSAIPHSNHQHVVFWRYATDYADQYGEPFPPDVPIEISFPYWDALERAMSELSTDGDAELYDSASAVMNPTDNALFFNELPVA